MLGIAVVAAAITTAVAVLTPWLPPAAGKGADRIHFVYWFTTVIAIAVFAVVVAVMGYSILHFRARPDDDSDGPPIHGHTTIEIVWTAVPAVLVTAISIVSAIVLAQNGHAGSDPLVVKVKAQQFAWSFTYPNGKTYGYLTLPKGRHTKLDITANDVIHSFWVPELSQKQDAVPGQHNTLVVTPTRTGTFPVICTELCGLGHALMRTQVDILTHDGYVKWARRGGTSAGGASAGVALFNSKGCNGCHTFAAASSGGQIGPNLDKLKEAAAGAKAPLEDFIRQSIEDPNAYVAPGYSANVMPPFKDQLTPKELDVLVKFLATNQK